MPRAQLDETVHVAGISEGVRDQEPAGAGRDGRLDQVRVDVVSARLDIEEDGDETVLQDGGKRRRKGHGGREDLVSRPEGVRLPGLARGGDHQQVGR